METGGVAWVLAEQQWHSDAIQACPGKEMYLYYRSLIILSKRRVKEAFWQGKSSKKLQVTVQAVRGWKERKSKGKSEGTRGRPWMVEISIPEIPTILRVLEKVQSREETTLIQSVC